MSARGNTILIIDDEPANLGVITNYLESSGYEVLSARDGEEGISKARYARPDLILLDVLMPGTDGFETCRRLKAEETTRDIPVIFMTVPTGTEDKAKGFEVGGVDFITKPFQETEVLARVATHLDVTERKRAEQSLQESEERYRTLVELSPEAIAVHSKGRIVYTNRAGVKLLGGAGTEELLGKPVLDFVHPGYKEIVKERVRKGYEKRASAERIEEKFVRLDGQTVDVEVSAAPITYMGEPATLLVIEDITNRKRMEAALRESEERFRRLAENAPDIITRYEVIPQPRCAFISPAITAMSGFTPEEYYADPYLSFKLVHPDDRPLLEAVDRGEVSPGTPITLRWVRKDGAIVWAEQRSIPIYDEAGNLAAVESIARDITERKQAEQALARRAREMAALYQTSLEINSQPDISTLLPAIVRRAAELLGTRMGGLYLVRPDDPVLELVVSYNLPRDYTGVTLCLGEGLSGRIAQTGQPMMVEDYSHWEGRTAVYADITTRRVLGVPLKVRDKVIGVINVTDDKTGTFDEEQVRLLSLFADQAAIAIENIRLVEALRQSNAELEARNEELHAFAHTVAHDLKSLLLSVVGYAELLAQEYATLPDEERLRFLQIVVRGGRKMDNILDELLLLAGLRQVEVEVRPLDMASIVAEAQQRLTDMIVKSRAEMDLPAASTWPVAVGYAPWVEEVWVNYLSNAIKYGGQPPRVELGAEVQPDGMARFWVRDHGPGITPEDQARLFTPFTRLDQVRVKGYGLGLSIVRRIVEKLGGQVGVTSAPGQGSVFSFTLRGSASGPQLLSQK